MNTNFDNLSRPQLIAFIKDFIAASELDENIPADFAMFLDLQRKVVRELSGQRIYKVSTVDASHSNIHGVCEVDTRYYASLRAAKRELRRRYNEQRRNVYVAAPYEIQEKGLTGGIDPGLLQSTLSNHDCPLRAPDRFKFYEVRMLHKNKVVPVQFILTVADVIPARENTSWQDVSKAESGSVGNVIEFNSIRDSIR